MPQIRGVLFDKDGTLFDFQGTWGSWAQGLFLDLSGGDAARAAEAFVAAWGTGAGWADEVADTAETAAPQIERISIPLHELSATPKASQRPVSSHNSAPRSTTWPARAATSCSSSTKRTSCHLNSLTNCASCSTTRWTLLL